MLTGHLQSHLGHHLMDHGPAKHQRRYKVSKGAKIRNRYNQVPHLTQDTNDTKSYMIKMFHLLSRFYLSSNVYIFIFTQSMLIRFKRFKD